MASSPLAGSLLVAVGWLAVAVLGLVPTNNAFFARRIAFPLGAAAGVALAAFGLQAVWLPPQILTLPLGLPDLPFHLRVDPLAGFFLMLLGSVSAGISVYAAGYFGNEPSGRLTLISLQYHVFLASMAFVLLADDAYLFMVAWETMALSSYFLVITDHQQPAIRSAGFLYLLIAHLGAIAILLCFGVLHGGRGDYTFGVLYALMQHDLKRLLAYHSVENIGIILLGLGMSMVFIGFGHAAAGVLALIAALYHTLNHAVFKGLLFLGAGSILHATGLRNLNDMGGLIRGMPRTAFYFLIGALAISALPPLNGFVSEWLTFQAALQATILQHGVVRSLLPLFAATLALAV